MNTRLAAGDGPATERTIPDMDLIEVHIKHIKAAGLARNTVEDRTAILRRMDRELPMGLERATVEELEHWLSRDGWSTSTRATYYAHVRSFFTWAGHPNRPLLDWDPSASLSRPRVPPGVPRPCSDDELIHALRWARDPWRRLVLLAAYAGLRCCELAVIERGDITDRTLMVRGKGGKTRVVPTNPEVWQVVEPLPAGLIAGGKTAELITRVGNSYLHRLGLTGVTFHRFRHWFGTNLLRHGADLRTVQELMGHASVSTTAGYTQITDEQRRIAIAALPVLIAPASA